MSCRAGAPPQLTLRPRGGSFARQCRLGRLFFLEDAPATLLTVEVVDDAAFGVDVERDGRSLLARQLREQRVRPRFGQLQRACYLLRADGPAPMLHHRAHGLELYCLPSQS